MVPPGLDDPIGFPSDHDNVRISSSASSSLEPAAETAGWSPLGSGARYYCENCATLKTPRHPQYLAQGGCEPPMRWVCPLCCVWDARADVVHHPLGGGTAASPARHSGTVSAVVVPLAALVANPADTEALLPASTRHLLSPNLWAAAVLTLGLVDVSRSEAQQAAETVTQTMKLQALRLT
jgi:hypothetical protein